MFCKDYLTYLTITLLFHVSTIHAFSVSNNASLKAIRRNKCLSAAKGYVPSGLTEEEYEKIKQKEAEELSKKNFGAFGPRFLQTERPDGDWMIIPSLWTQGFRSSPNPNISDEILEDKNKVITSAQKLGQRIRRSGPILLTSLLLIETIIAMITVAMKGSSKASLFLSLVTMSEKKMLLPWVGNPLVKLTKVLGVLGLHKLLSNFIEHANRRWLWSHRRSLTTISLSALSFMSIWIGVIRLLGNFL